MARFYTNTFAHLYLRSIIVALFVGLFSYNTLSQKNQVAQVKKKQLITKDDTIRFLQLMQRFNYYESIKPDSSLFFAEQMVLLAEQSDDINIKSIAYGNYGHEQYVLGNYPQALQMLFKALQLAENINDSSHIANLNNSIGNTYKEYEDYGRAIPHYLSCKIIAEKINDPRNLLFANMNLGFVYERLNKLDSALLYGQYAYMLETKYHIGRLDFVLNILGNIQSSLNNQSLALEYYRAAIAEAQRNGKTRYLCMSYIALAALYQKCNKTDSAIYYAEQSLKIAKDVPYLKGIGKAGKFLASLYESINHTDKAFNYQKIYIAINDSIYHRERNSTVENLSFWELVRKQEKVLGEKRRNDNRKQNLQYVSIAIGIVAFVFLFLLISRTIITNTRLIAFLGVIALLIVFEFLNLLLHPFLENLTHHSPLLMLLAMVCIAALLVPLHHKLEQWAITKLVEKNKQIRLAAARKTIEQLDPANRGYTS